MVAKKLGMQPPNDDDTQGVTFWEGELIDAKNCTFYTGEWEAIHIKHSNGALSMDIISISKRSKLLLPHRIPAIELDLPAIGVEIQRMNLNTNGRFIFLLKLPSQMPLHKGGLPYPAITYDHKMEVRNLPPTDWIKYNVDASLDGSYQDGVGGVIRDSKGRFLFAFGCKRLHWDSLVLELQAIFSLGKVVNEWMYEAKGIIIEGDNYNIMKFVERVLNKEVNLEVGPNQEDFFFLRSFNQVVIQVVNRECNKLADYCANIAKSSDFVWDSLNDYNISPYFVKLLKEECDNCHMY
ncbi:hypothetical protein IEQ34_012052 [Dendrobium chrysotoxum]|uniref:RNase H type-1 domain-containing protein n=1 Tax=Dendrobium chrysotoxum TaxID=161865 RepID=A0AAV7GU66_DENCH|nr:hypothetical protein IEQ34_012052 [Dendrobium chrysotoxum]